MRDDETHGQDIFPDKKYDKLNVFCSSATLNCDRGLRLFQKIIGKWTVTSIISCFVKTMVISFRALLHRMGIRYTHICYSKSGSFHPIMFHPTEWDLTDWWSNDSWNNDYFNIASLNLTFLTLNFISSLS